jgi:hypothetical protein
VSLERTQEDADRTQSKAPKRRLVLCSHMMSQTPLSESGPSIKPTGQDLLLKMQHRHSLLWKHPYPLLLPIALQGSQSHRYRSRWWKEQIFKAASLGSCYMKWAGCPWKASLSPAVKWHNSYCTGISCL